jgi:hypothetical protein
MLARRQFLIGSTVTLVLTPLVAACSSGSMGYGSSPSTGGGGRTCDGLGETSTVVEGHDHFVCVPAADLANQPSAGATYTTTTDAGHHHTITLTMEQLKSVADGGTVTVTTTNDQGHTHDFTLKMM